MRRGRKLQNTNILIFLSGLRQFVYLKIVSLAFKTQKYPNEMCLCNEFQVSNKYHELTTILVQELWK